MTLSTSRTAGASQTCPDRGLPVSHPIFLLLPELGLGSSANQTDETKQTKGEPGCQDRLTQARSED